MDLVFEFSDGTIGTSRFNDETLAGMMGEGCGLPPEDLDRLIDHAVHPPSGHGLPREVVTRNKEAKCYGGLTQEEAVEAILGVVSATLQVSDGLHVLAYHIVADGVLPEENDPRRLTRSLWRWRDGAIDFGG